MATQCQGDLCTKWRRFKQDLKTQETVRWSLQGGAWRDSLWAPSRFFGRISTMGTSLEGGLQSRGNGYSKLGAQARGPWEVLGSQGSRASIPPRKGAQAGLRARPDYVTTLRPWGSKYQYHEDSEFLYMVFGKYSLAWHVEPHIPCWRNRGGRHLSSYSTSNPQSSRSSLFPRGSFQKSGALIRTPNLI